MMRILFLCMMLCFLVGCSDKEDEKIKFYNVELTEIDGVSGYKIKLKSDYLPTGTKYQFLPSELTIPSDYKGNPIIAIADSAFFGCAKLSYVTFPQNTKTIGNSAFLGCYGMQNLIVINGITSIGNSAFAYCDGLESVTIQSSVQSIGDYAFMHCSNLVKLSLVKGLRLIGYAAFMDCFSLEKISIPEGVERIEDEAFANTKMCEVVTEGAVPAKLGTSVFQMNGQVLDSLVIYVPEGFEPAYKMVWFEYMDRVIDKSIPDDVRETPSKFFNFILNMDGTGYLVALKSVYFTEALGATLPQDIILPTYYGGFPVVGIAEAGFTCSGGEKVIVMPDGTTQAIGNEFVKTKNIIFPEHLKSVGDRAFEDSKIMSFVFSDSLTQIGYCAFKGSAMAQVRIPENTQVGDFAFYQCNALNHVSIMNGVTLGVGVFDQCYNLKSVALPSTLSRIEKGTFRGCKNLQRVTVPANVRYIADGAFEECHSLKSVTIPAQVDTIGMAAFKGCLTLNSFTIEKPQPPYLQNDVFGKLPSGIKIYVPAGTGEIYKTDVNWAKYAAVIQDPEASEEVAEEVDSVAHETSAEYFDFELTDAKNAYRLTLKPDFSVEGSRMSSLPMDIILPSTFNGLPVTEINDNAFKACAISTLVLPDSLTRIGRYAFVYCSSLVSITSKSMTPPSIENNALRNTPASLVIYVPEASLKAYKSAKGWSKYAGKIKPLAEEKEVDGSVPHQ